MKKIILTITIFSFIMLTGCVDMNTNKDRKLCATVSDMNMDTLNKIPNSCKKGESIAFLPNSFGNEQFPVVAASVLCDINYQIVNTNGGVYCVFADDIQNRVKFFTNK